MLPVLLRLNGTVQVSEAGEMLYVFPELQRRAARGGDRGLGRAFRAAVSWVEDKAAFVAAPPAPFIAQEGAPAAPPLREVPEEECLWALGQLSLRCADRAHTVQGARSTWRRNGDPCLTCGLAARRRWQRLCW